MPFYDHSKNQYYSFNQGKIHFIAINYLFYKTEQEGSDKQKDNANRMYQWVKNDLATANATRDYRPWIVIMSHYPIYCSSSDCSKYHSDFSDWEQLWYEYRVDLVLQSHVKYWERMGPIFDNKLQGYYTWPESPNISIINSEAPVYTLDGASGSSEKTASVPSLAAYSINASNTVGYS